MTMTLLHAYGWWVVEIVDSLIDGLHGIQGDSALLHFLLWPLSYALTFVRKMARSFAFGSWAFPNRVVPAAWRGTCEHFMSASPLSIYCFSKAGFAVLLTEFIFFFYSCWIWMGQPLFIFTYSFLKISLSLISFVSLSPVQRLPFWILAVAFAFVEGWCGVKLIRLWGYGIDFYGGHYYNHWPKHYRYRHITSNRIIGTELCKILYVTAKVSVLNDWICRDKYTTKVRLEHRYRPSCGLEIPSASEDRLRAAGKPTRVHIFEQDALANLQYDTLLLLALIFIGVYTATLVGWSSSSKYALVGAVCRADIAVMQNATPVTEIPAVLQRPLRSKGHWCSRTSTKALLGLPYWLEHFVMYSLQRNLEQGWRDVEPIARVVWYFTMKVVTPQQVAVFANCVLSGLAGGLFGLAFVAAYDQYTVFMAGDISLKSYNITFAHRDPELARMLSEPVRKGCEPLLGRCHEGASLFRNELVEHCIVAEYARRSPTATPMGAVSALCHTTEFLAFAALAFLAGCAFLFYRLRGGAVHRVVPSPTAVSAFTPKPSPRAPRPGSVGGQRRSFSISGCQLLKAPKPQQYRLLRQARASKSNHRTGRRTRASLHQQIKTKTQN